MPCLSIYEIGSTFKIDGTSELMLQDEAFLTSSAVSAVRV
jgi:hypothetical protein